MFAKLNNWFNGPSLIIYIACKMSGRDKIEMIERAKFVVNLCLQAKIKPLSPVLEENVKPTPGVLVNKDEICLREFWARDKAIIRYLAHAVLLDYADMKSFGMEREYALNRYCLWKPTVMILNQGVDLSVSKYEDDGIFYSTHSAISYLSQNFLSRRQRWQWRIKMLYHSLPKWLLSQVYAWR